MDRNLPFNAHDDNHFFLSVSAIFASNITKPSIIVSVSFVNNIVYLVGFDLSTYLYSCCTIFLDCKIFLIIKNIATTNSFVNSFSSSKTISPQFCAVSPLNSLSTVPKMNFRQGTIKFTLLYFTLGLDLQTVNWLDEARFYT